LPPEQLVISTSVTTNTIDAKTLRQVMAFILQLLSHRLRWGHQSRGRHDRRRPEPHAGAACGYRSS
jgi:hypothetical protein